MPRASSIGPPGIWRRRWPLAIIYRQWLQQQLQQLCNYGLMACLHEPHDIVSHLRFARVCTEITTSTCKNIMLCIHMSSTHAITEHILSLAPRAQPIDHRGTMGAASTLQMPKLNILPFTTKIDFPGRVWIIMPRFCIEKARRKRQKVCVLGQKCAFLIAASWTWAKDSIALIKNGFYFGVSYAPSQPRTLM